jgi:ADP-ribosylation factor-like protein 4
VFVVDSVDRERLEEARVELLRTARAPETANVPVLVLANKQDLPGSMDVPLIEKAMGLHELSATTSRVWSIQPACAITGEGLDEALEHLYQMILKRRKALKQAKKKR